MVMDILQRTDHRNHVSTYSLTFYIPYHSLSEIKNKARQLAYFKSQTRYLDSEVFVTYRIFYFAPQTNTYDHKDECKNDHHCLLQYQERHFVECTCYTFIVHK